MLVCDAFHAMVTDRPYRKHLPDEEAVRRLRAAAGTQFDPGVVASSAGSSTRARCSRSSSLW